MVWNLISYLFVVVSKAIVNSEVLYVQVDFLSYCESYIIWTTRFQFLECYLIRGPCCPNFWNIVFCGPHSPYDFWNLAYIWTMRTTRP